MPKMDNLLAILGMLSSGNKITASHYSNNKQEKQMNHHLTSPEVIRLIS